MKKTKLLVLLILCLALISCARQVKERSFSPPDATHRILIASDASDFKDTIRDRLVDNYVKFAHIDVVNVSNLNNVEGDTYDAILIMDTSMGWNRLNVSFKRFVDNLENKDRVVLFFTTGDNHWDYQYQDVDAVTSASIVENEKDVFEALRSRIDRVLASAGNASSRYPRQ
jgi:GTP cyclohydrolase III